MTVDAEARMAIPARKIVLLKNMAKVRLLNRVLILWVFKVEKI